MKSTVLYWNVQRHEYTRLASSDIATGSADALQSGHLIYVRAGTLLAAPFDLRQLAITGGAIRILSDVMQAANSATSSISIERGALAPDDAFDVDPGLLTTSEGFQNHEVFGRAGPQADRPPSRIPCLTAGSFAH